MTISLKQLLLILGGVLLAIGLVLGFMPISHDGGPCGSAFIGSQDNRVESHTRAMTGGDWRGFDAGCTDATSSRRTFALALAIPGALLAGAGLVMGNQKQDQAAPVTQP